MGGKMKYVYDATLTAKAREIAVQLGMHYIKPERISVIRSKGSKTRRTVARIHNLGKVMQLGMGQEAFYTIELLSEKFNKASEGEQMKTLIHELMHIPKGFGGGFRNHGVYVTEKEVNNVYQQWQKQQSGQGMVFKEGNR